MHSFTKKQLYQVRNDIDIDWLINQKLDLNQKFKGIWRFQCPLCSQFNTSTKKTSNLARCFDCNKNFNTIDLVIYTKKLNFIPSVQWLISLLDKKIRSHHTHVINSEKDNEVTARTRKIGLQEIEKMKLMVR